jgi:predicted DNA-binding protein (MmcQ/YjbR family)
MDLDALRNYCLTKHSAEECFPFDDVTLVFKVGGKMFALIGTDEHPLTINLKCDPEIALELRERHDAVTPAYHQNKKHWNTVTLDGSVRPALVKEWIDASYDLVVASLTKAQRASLT